MKKINYTIGAVVLATASALTLAPLSVNAMTKNEIIYSNMNYNGEFYKTIVNNHLTLDGEKEELEAIPDTPTTPDEFGAAGLINALIQDEWQAIQGYNDAIATLSTTDIDTDIINVFKDIANEENIHIGQLQKALEMVSPNVSSISEGEQEGAEQLEEPDTDM